MARRISDEEEQRIVRDFGRLIVKLRGDDMSRETLAELSKSHPNSIGAIERGESNPSLVTIVLIARALELKPSHLLKMMDY